MNLYEEIKQMSIDEMAIFLSDLSLDAPCNAYFGVKAQGKCNSNCKKCVKAFLEKEVDT